MNRIVSNMPYHKLTQMITYKAQWAGVPVVKISERDTSKTCHRCGERGSHPYQGLFKCSNCGLKYNVDLNGAINIARRFSEQCSGNGAAFDTALNSGEVKPC
jgi:transposase